VLKAVAQRFDGLRAQTDLVRVGGDEFVVLLNGIKGSQEAAKVADKLIDVLAEPFLSAIRGYHSGSIGVSHFPQDGAEADYCSRTRMPHVRAKELGRNNYQFFCVDMNVDVAKQLE